ncbi:cleavage and polyadenylation specificity factor subunit 6/7 [Sciurus carolinensis]|uniref:Cleavage and polyadenylation specificity factor subunit 6/7 n=1 Tax=Sciurus carolinensis TaxID=30640 RepID=A0AA41T9I6_SCICA|nr:cleavage and polyadenylation specificity factor subunit 6/7 [Sciurus carolinensis]
MIVAKFLLALCKIAFMELNPSHMVLDQDVNDQERGTIVDHEKKSRRHKSHSRDRHDDYYRERSREQERHPDRDRDRDREREYRHR